MPSGTYIDKFSDCTAHWEQITKVSEKLHAYSFHPMSLVCSMKLSCLGNSESTCNRSGKRIGKSEKTKRRVDHKFTTTFLEQAQYNEMKKDMHQGAPETSRSE